MASNDTPMPAVTPVTASTTLSISVRPLQVHPSANIRQIRTKWVAKLMALFVENGWRESEVKVYANVPYAHVRALVDRNDAEAMAELDSLSFKVLDGAHRIRALRILVKDPEVPSFNENSRITVQVRPEARTVIQRSLDAAAENERHDDLYAKKTFTDDLWAMIGIYGEVVRRVVDFSTAVAELPPDADAGENPATAAENAGRRRRRSRRNDLSMFSNLPEETASFIAAYCRHIDKHLTTATRSEIKRRPFNPKAVADMKNMKPHVVLALLQDSYMPDGHDALVCPTKEFVLVKWRILRKLFPVEVSLVPLLEDEDSLTGGSGIVPDPTQDRRIWEYLCAVNDALTCKSDDLLSYKRLYKTPFRNNAYTRIFCGLLMLTQAAYTREATRRQGRDFQRGDPFNSVSDEFIEETYCTVCAIFQQYDFAASLLPSYTSLEELLVPYLRLDRCSFQFTVATAKDEWVDPGAFTSLEESTYLTRTHPKFGKQFADMDPAEKTHDDECKALAGFLLDDLKKSRILNQQDNIAEFGFFQAKTDNVNDDMQFTKLTSHVRSRFMVLRTAGFREAVEAARREHEGVGLPATDVVGGAANAPDADDGIESAVFEPPARRLHLTQPDADINEAKSECIKALRENDDIRMFSCGFEDFARLSDVQELYGKVALVLTDPPYNTRRESGAMNSDYDKLSLSAMKDAADLIEKLLRPYGHGFVFCSFQQGMEWRSALEGAGGGSSLKLPSVPEVITREKGAVHSGGRFRYHRTNSYENAWLFHKDKPGASSAEFGETVRFGDPTLELLGGMTMPTYSNVIDNYVPPKGVEVIHFNGRPMRAEQKSVRLLRDLIRLFAPNPNDIVVDLFGGTMSTVIATLLEGRPAYVCEKDPECFRVGEARVHEFQYRRGAAGLVRRLAPRQITLLQSSIPARSRAPDEVPHEPETYITQTQSDA